jgi:single-strand DNA-binding protein
VRRAALLVIPSACLLFGEDVRSARMPDPRAGLWEVFLRSDAKSRTANNDVNVTVFSLATKTSWRDSESGKWMSHTEWHRCVAFGPLAQAASVLKKGDHLHVQGQIQTREYSADKSSANQRVTEIRVSPVFRVERLARTAPDRLRDGGIGRRSHLCPRY